MYLNYSLTSGCLRKYNKVISLRLSFCPHPTSRSMEEQYRPLPKNQEIMLHRAHHKAWLILKSSLSIFLIFKELLQNTFSVLSLKHMHAHICSHAFSFLCFPDFLFLSGHISFPFLVHLSMVLLPSKFFLQDVFFNFFLYRAMWPCFGLPCSPSLCSVQQRSHTQPHEQRYFLLQRTKGCKHGRILYNTVEEGCLPGENHTN